MKSQSAIEIKKYALLNWRAIYVIFLIMEKNQGGKKLVSNFNSQ